MLYLIGGASRSGKTIIAKQAATHLGISNLSLDWLMMGFTNGIPEYGIHDLLFPDEIAQRMWPFLQAMMESMIYVGTDCIIEGEALLPELVNELIVKYPKEIKVCFLGYTDVPIEEKVKAIRAYSNAKNDWLTDKSEAYIVDHVQNMIAHSRLIKQSCWQNGIQYFDTSDQFIDSIGKTISFIYSPNDDGKK